MKRNIVLWPQPNNAVCLWEKDVVSYGRKHKTKSTSHEVLFVLSFVSEKKLVKNLIFFNILY